ncbi:hypothetical protein BBJ29_007186 [Phytophthora kernoviae]|uniref:Uncharacterized protein n=1 Tax=Phytophthora kernoviae TaxID=325452 RepID=A0A3R7JJM5_9STRA|nr:hypothetical protein BBJ29_007186 [Phytophthora kernoviae]
MTVAALQEMRGTNAKLMEKNLSLLMEIREVDADIEDLRRQLQSQCELLGKRGSVIPHNSRISCFHTWNER